MTVHVNTSALTAAGLYGKRAQQAEVALGQQILKDTEPYVPMLTGSLKNRSQYQKEQHRIVYPGPYARYLYYGKVMVSARTGRGPRRWTSPDGTELIRWRKGEVLTPTNRDLKMNKASHPLATAKWLEASKAKNLAKWQRMVQAWISRHGTAQ